MSGPAEGGPQTSLEASLEAPPVDLLVTGTVFLDLIFTGLPAAPVGGREIMAEGMGSSPGGAANMAVAASRLGLTTGLAAVFGTDVYGDYCWSTLEDDEGIDLSWSRRLPGWHSPVTVSLAYDDDRAMITHAHEPAVETDQPPASLPAARACFADVGTKRAPWVDRLIEAGSLVFADVGWDGSGTWDAAGLRSRLEGCHAFVPNAAEAMAYTGRSHPGAALEVLRDWVPLAVVTAGSGGAYAADERTGETVWVPGLPSPAIDPTGAGDVFLAALVLGTLHDWPLLQRIRFANLAAALSVRDLGGALAAPGWADICDWWSDVDPGSRLARDYAFVEGLLHTHEHRVFSRAVPTIGFTTVTHDHSRHGPRPIHRTPGAPPYRHPLSQPVPVTSQENP
ncbi:MAG: putative carbohydrate kinase [uncultured Nocardioidaceae bacterium]|uniref:Putative carbohydrate kinase n=1 Tax=uncultured Nocardioidaceae bacterium TaxID=253824 RepID=A0A6J4KZN0_9ACTN|nr:MAG: putative carbohydrate kinase [uncultured Nocardioidaceae bacterium]